jgi:hypothetical protein
MPMMICICYITIKSFSQKLHIVNAPKTWVYCTSAGLESRLRLKAAVFGGLGGCNTSSPQAKDQWREREGEAGYCQQGLLQQQFSHELHHMVLRHHTPT